MVGKLLDNGLIVIKKDVRELLDISHGDFVHLNVKKIEQAQTETEQPTN